MTLEQWVHNNLDDLNSEKPDSSAIKELISVAEREIIDAHSVSSSEEVNEIQNYRHARHQSIYDFASVVSESKADCALRTAESLLSKFREWIKANHPELR